MKRPLLRIWHFFRGHPADQLWGLLIGEAHSEYECEGCGKAGKRL